MFPIRTAAAVRHRRNKRMNGVRRPQRRNMLQRIERKLMELNRWHFLGLLSERERLQMEELLSEREKMEAAIRDCPE